MNGILSKVSGKVLVRIKAISEMTLKLAFPSFVINDFETVSQRIYVQVYGERIPWPFVYSKCVLLVRLRPVNYVQVARICMPVLATNNLHDIHWQLQQFWLLYSSKSNKDLGANWIQICHLTSTKNPIMDIRRSCDRRISTNVVRKHLYEIKAQGPVSI